MLHASAFCGLLLYIRYFFENNPARCRLQDPKSIADRVMYAGIYTQVNPSIMSSILDLPNPSCKVEVLCTIPGIQSLRILTHALEPPPYMYTGRIVASRVSVIFEICIRKWTDMMHKHDVPSFTEAGGEPEPSESDAL